MIGTPYIHGYEVLVIEACCVNKFLEELILLPRGTSTNKEVAIRLDRLHCVFQTGVSALAA